MRKSEICERVKLMPKSTNEVLAEIEERKNKISRMTAEDFKKAYNDLTDKGFPTEATADFVFALGHSSQIEYHYELLFADWLNGTVYSNLSGWFKAHDEAVVAYLLTKLQNEDDCDFHGQIVFLLAKVLDELKTRPFYSERKKEVVSCAENLLLSEHIEIRRNAIIALGWIGGIEQVLLLCDRLLNDHDYKCRAWAATAFMQMWFRNKTKDIADKIKPCLLQRLQREQDYFVLGCILETTQTLETKRWLTQNEIDAVDKDTITKAKQSAIRFLKKAPMV